MSWYDNIATPVDPRLGDSPTVEVAALIPIMSTAASRPLRGLSRLIIIVGLAFSALSLIGGVVWLVTISSSVNFAQSDVRDAADRKDDHIYFNLDKESSNIRLVLMLAGTGVAVVGFVLGLVMVVIGGVARQLDRTLAPIASPTANGPPPMAAVAYPGAT
jgi:hypothetical protein